MLLLSYHRFDQFPYECRSSLRMHFNIILRGQPHTKQATEWERKRDRIEYGWIAMILNARLILSHKFEYDRATNRNWCNFGIYNCTSSHIFVFLFLLSWLATLHGNRCHRKWCEAIFGTKSNWMKMSPARLRRERLRPSQSLSRLKIIVQTETVVVDVSIQSRCRAVDQMATNAATNSES